MRGFVTRFHRVSFRILKTACKMNVRRRLPQITLQREISITSNVLPLKLYNQGTMTFYAHENVENLGVYIFSCSFTRALICGKIIINDVVSVQPQKEIEMKTTDINKVRYTNRWRIVYGICNN